MIGSHQKYLKISKFIYFIIFLVFFIFNILHYKPLYGYVPYDESSESSSHYVVSNDSFQPNDYEIDYSKQHKYLNWKYENGHSFSDNARSFYGIEGTKAYPCRTYQEFANKKQLFFDFIGFFPGAANVSDLLSDNLDGRNDKIALLNEFVYYHLLGNPCKSCFFFDLKDLDEIQKVDIAFCDCDMDSSGLIVNIISILDTLFDEELESKDLNKGLELIYQFSQYGLNQSKKDFIEILKSRIKKKIKKKIGHAVARTSLKKSTKKTVGKTLGRYLFPGFFHMGEVVYNQYQNSKESEMYIKNNMSFYVTNNSYEKTIGFILHFKSLEEVSLYEVKKDYNHHQTTNLIKTVNIADSSHMLINLVQKKWWNEKKDINIYQGKLK